MNNLLFRRPRDWDTKISVSLTYHTECISGLDQSIYSPQAAYRVLRSQDLTYPWCLGQGCHYLISHFYQVPINKWKFRPYICGLCIWYPVYSLPESVLLVDVAQPSTREVPARLAVRRLVDLGT